MINAALGTSRAGLLEVVAYLLGMAVIVVTVVILFNYNKEIDNQNFIERVICIGLPAAVRAYVSYWAVFVSVALLGSVLPLPELAWSIFVILCVSFHYLLFFVFLRHGFTRLRT